MGRKGNPRGDGSVDPHASPSGRVDPQKYWKNEGKGNADHRRDLLDKQREGERVVEDDDETAK